MAGICTNRIKAGKGCNYHIFLNSTEDSSSIARTAQLKPENTRFICSQSEEAFKKNLSKLPNGFTISKALDEVKPINFYTSTCFEGQDIKDPNGRTFVVSNAHKEHTMLDISTTFIQICGRIRNSEYNDEIVHFYSSSRYNDITLEEFERVTYEQVREAEEFAEYLDASKYKQKMLAGIGHMNEPYVKVENNKIIVDRNLANLDIVNYKVVNGIYQSQINVIKELKKNGLNITDDTSYTTPKDIELMNQVKMPFKNMFELYCYLKDNHPLYSLTPDFRIELIETRNPLVKKAYDILGRDKVREMKHHQSNIKRKLIALSAKKFDNKVVEYLDEVLSPQTPIPVEEVKRHLRLIYNELGMTDKAACATHLRNWYEIKPVTKEINGKNTACVMIIRSKFMRLHTPEVEF